MTHQQIYDELKQLAEQMGIAVRLEVGDFDGGSCTVNEQRVILINRRHDITRRVNVLARALHGEGLDEVFVKPALRDFIEDEVARARAAGAQG